MQTEKLAEIINQPMSYKQLCAAIELEPKGGTQKIAQLENLQLYCAIEKTSNPTRYIVREVYDAADGLLAEITKNDRCGLLFEAAIYQYFKDYNNKPLKLSKMQMIELFKEVNENFKYSCRADIMEELAPELTFMSDMSLSVYRFLSKWTMRKISSMDARGSIILRRGYRLYRIAKYKNGGCRVAVVTDVPENSKLEERCTTIFNKAVEAAMPPNWKDGWVPKWQWELLEKKIKELIKEEFRGEYTDMKRIYILRPPTKEWVSERLEKIYNSINVYDEIGEAAKNKVLTSNEFNKTYAHDGYTDLQKQIFTSINMDANPVVSWKKELKEKEEKKYGQAWSKKGEFNWSKIWETDSD